METTATVKGYKLDFTTNTMIVNYTFHAESGKYGTPEYNLLKAIQSDFPNMRIEVKSGREKKTTNKNKRLTYKNMKKHISVYENADELLAVFDSVEMASKSMASPYKYVCDWFKAQFPDYNKSLIFKDKKLVAAPVTPPDVKEYRKKIVPANSDTINGTEAPDEMPEKISA